MKQGAYESITTYKEWFNNALKAYIDQCNPGMNEADIAIDFFRGLDNAWYTGFKTEIFNRLTAKSITQPANLNVMYLLANQGVKLVTRGPAGFVSTFHTMLNRTKKQCGNQCENNGKKRDGKWNGGKQLQQNLDKKEWNNKKDSIDCFAYSELGHYANKSLTRK